VFYTVFGSNRIVLFTELEMDTQATIGNIMFFLSNGTPLAWGLFDYNIKKEAKGPDTAGDWMVIALGVEKLNILDKFDLDPLQSTAFELPEAETNESAIIAFSKNRKILMWRKRQPATSITPAPCSKAASGLSARSWFRLPKTLRKCQAVQSVTIMIAAYKRNN
jgi:hypothetical protein